MKRLFDILVSIIGLVLSSPILLLGAIAVRVTSPGSVIFAQPRVGRFQRVFTCYKLRTMVEGTRVAGTHEIAEASVTPIGKILRSTKLDELPQLWNVLRGDMSLVGPRPCLTVQTELIEAREKEKVFDVAPGITGLAQLEGIDMSTPDRLAKRDAEYVKNQSFWLDLKLILFTALGKGAGDRVNARGVEN